MSTPTANALISLPLTRGKAAGMTSVQESGEPEVARLTRALAAGDEEAFRQFHAAYFDRLYRFLLVVTRGQEQEAQDALQQTLLRLIKHARVFESEDAFWSWLKVVARSAARDSGRKQRRYSILLQNFASRFNLLKPPAYSQEEDRLLAALHESLAELPPDERALLESKYLGGFTIRELSLENRVTEKAVESRLARVRHILRNKVLKKLSQL